MDPVSSRELDSRSIERIVEHRRGSKLRVFFSHADALIRAKSPEVLATFRGSDGEKWAHLCELGWALIITGYKFWPIFAKASLRFWVLNLENQCRREKWRRLRSDASVASIPEQKSEQSAESANLRLKQTEAKSCDESLLSGMNGLIANSLEKWGKKNPGVIHKKERHKFLSKNAPKVKSFQFNWHHLRKWQRKTRGF